MRADIQVSSFAAGELSPRMKGRTDHEKYFIGNERMQNAIVLPQGGWTRRPGTQYSADTYDQANPPRLIPFVFSTVQAYMLEFGNATIRVFMNGAPVLGGSGPGGQVLIATPYATADLPMLKYVQSADTLYLFHGKYPTAKLTRASHTVWAYTPINFKDGPYMPVDISPTTLQPSANTGNVTVTASGIAGINNGVGFMASDVGRLIRYSSKIKPGGTAGTTVGASYGYMKITNYVDATHVKADVMPQSGKPDDTTGIRPGTLDGTTASNNWRLGRFSATTGYPYCGTFFQERLVLGGTDQVPNGIWGSVVGDFESFPPTEWDGAVVATDGYEFIISDDQVNPIYWLNAAGSAQQAQLGIGTGGGEDVLQSASGNTSVTPTSIEVYRETQLTSAKTSQPVRVGKSLLFVNGPGLKLHEWTFEWTVNGYSGPDLAVISEHLPKPGIVETAYQRSPYGILWARRTDGYLVAFTYLAEEKVVAWHRHELGGSLYGGTPFIESLACIPSPDGSYDQLWLAVLRVVNGALKRTIEILTRYFDPMLMQQEQAWFVDCGLATPVQSPAFILSCPNRSGLNQTFTASGAFFSAGSVGAIILYNGGVVKVTGYTSPTVVTGDYVKNARQAGPALSGAWNYAPPVTTVTGLGHLLNETVAVCGDGANYGRQTVVAPGTVTLDPAAAFVTVGLPYLSRVVSMPFEPLRSPIVSAAGRIKRIDTLFIRFNNTVACDYGARVTDDMTDGIEEILEPLESRSAGVPIGWPPPLFSGIRRVNFPGGYDREGQVIMQTDHPTPLTVLAIGISADIGEVPAQ